MTATQRTCEFGPHPEVDARWYVEDPNGFRVAVCDEHLVPSLAAWGSNTVSALTSGSPRDESTG